MPVVHATDSTQLVTNTILVSRLIPSVSFPDGEWVQKEARMEINAVSTADGETRFGIPFFTAPDNIILTDSEKNDLLIGADITKPVVIDTPFVSQGTGVLTCTKGNWEESPEPDAFTYQWQRSGVNVGTGTDTYPLTVDDIGGLFVCIVTAYNRAGFTPSVSNEVVV